METNGVVDRGSESEMRLPVNFAGSPADKRITMTKKVRSSIAAAEARRRRMPMVKRNGGLLKRKRTTIDRDSGFVPPPLPPYKSVLQNIKAKPGAAATLLPCMWPGGHGFKSWKQPLADMQGKDAYIIPKWPDIPMTYACGSFMHQIINQGRLVFLFYKKLQNSDVNNIGRTVLPKHSAETHLPRLFENESIILPVIDMDGQGAWSFKFRYWPNNESRMYVFEGTGHFTRKYRLQMGDYMLIYRDMVNWNYLIRAVKASEVEACANKEVTDNEGSSTDNVVLNDADFGELDISDDSAILPEMESTGGTSSMNDDGYFSDILNSFSSWDEIEDYYGPSTPAK